jgi:hypothetical protein
MSGLALPLTICYMPKPDKLTIGPELLVTGLCHCERRELLTSLHPGQVAAVKPHPRTQLRQRKTLSVAQGTQLRTPQIERRPLGDQDPALLTHGSLQ